MSTLDIIILWIAKVGLIVGMAAGVLLLGWIGLSCLWRFYRSAIGFPIVMNALAEYRRTHPEKFKHFDSTKTDSLL